MKETEEPAEPTTPTPSTSASVMPTTTSNESGSAYKGTCAFDFVVHARMKSLLTAYFYKMDGRRKADEDEQIDGKCKADKDE